MRLPRETYQIQQTIETHLPPDCAYSSGNGIYATVPRLAHPNYASTQRTRPRAAPLSAMRGSGATATAPVSFAYRNRLLKAPRRCNVG